MADHIGAVLIEPGRLRIRDEYGINQIMSTDYGMRLWQLDRALRCVGRLAFPIFAFCLVEGFCHTRHRKSYGLRLFLFALLSEVIFDLAVFDCWFYPEYQNIYVTLLIAFLTLWGMERFQENRWLPALIAVSGCIASYLLKADYGPSGVFLMILLYQLRGHPHQLWAGAILSALGSLNAYGFAGLAFILLAFYNKERGRWPGKHFFYLFYPAHLLFFYWIRVLVISPAL